MDSLTEAESNFVDEAKPGGSDDFFASVVEGFL
jgi:hypothetical protein